MARDATAIISAQQEHEHNDFPFAGLEANLIAEMGIESANQRHKHHDHMESHMRFGNHDGEGRRDDGGGHKKKKKKKHRDSFQHIASQETDGGSVDLDAPQRYIPTPSRKRKNMELHSSFEELPPTGAQPVEQEQAVDAVQNGENGMGSGGPLSAALQSKYLSDTSIKNAKPAHITDDDEEQEKKATQKEEKRRRKEEKRARKSLEGLKPTVSEDGARETVKEESAAETPQKKRKRAIELSSEYHQAPQVEQKSDDGSPQTPKSASMKKRKFDHSAKSTPLLLNTIPAHTHNSFLRTAINALPGMHVNDKVDATTHTPSSKDAQKLSQESPFRLHTVPPHGPSTVLNRINSDQDENKADGNSERKKKRKKDKHAKESTRSDLLHTVLKGSISEEAIKIPSSNYTSSSEDETEQRSRDGTPTPVRPPKSKAILPPSPAPILPKKGIDDHIRKETPIPPPKRLVHYSTGSPSILPKLAKKIKAESTVDSDDEVKKAMKKRKLSTSNNSKAAAEEESFSQAIGSIKKATDSKIKGLFSDDEIDEEEEEDYFGKAFDSIRRSSMQLANLFSNADAHSAEKKQGKASKLAKVARARSVSASKVQPLAFEGDGLNQASEDWESTIGKVRSAAGSGDDSEAQENIAFSASYIASRSAGIKISNTTFQVHNLRHNEGWVVSSAERETGGDGKDFKLKICTIMSGRVQIRLGSNAFGVGKGSVFRVRSGEECVVRNGEKKAAVVWVVCVE